MCQFTSGVSYNSIPVPCIKRSGIAEIVRAFDASIL